MPYVTKYREARKTVEIDMGFDPIPIIRPNFVFFQFTGLRPSTPHWIFFDGVEVTKFVNTDYSLSSFNTLPRNSALREPGDQFTHVTQFPPSLGGGSNGGLALTPINSDNTGTLEGCFYIQSNATINFPTGNRSLTAIDLSVLNNASRDRALSLAQGEYKATAQYELFAEIEELYQEQYELWVDPPQPTNNSSGSNNDRGSAAAHYYYEEKATGKKYTVYGDYSDVAGYKLSQDTNDDPNDDGKEREKGSANENQSCVVATYANEIGSDILNRREKKKAEIWCIRQFHGKWWGEALRRGYRYLGRKAIASGTAERHFQEFVDYVNFGSGKNRKLKSGLNFVYRTIQFITLGLTVARREK
jgi:hypothetical protein